MPYTVKGEQRNTGRTHFKKGQAAWNKGIKYTQITQEKHPNWHGDQVEYMGLHAWVRKQLGRPTLCQHCKSSTEKRYEWANISGEYKRDLNDWIRLCKSCHNKFDVARGKWGEATKLIKAQKLARKAKMC